jgi:ElaB/YqjD/DUF883 family membrane-anchored ribosome-binding protein
MPDQFDDIQDVLHHVADFAKQSYGDIIDPLSERFAFHRAPTTGEHAGAPMVLILGNHSSGKSTFINFMLEADIQRTGLAPIDDGFTILNAGSPDEKDGQAVVTNPELPFGDLERFGPKFISHLRMKHTESEFLKSLCLVDTPGMIDAADGQLGRGYDFISAVRWFVERSDVVCVFFDPDKPGTTGETLKVFTSALLDIDHKLLIVLNKMDQFRTLRDFARAYGALCWNLSKVIPRKDLPMIYNTYVPVEGAPTPAMPLKDFGDAREEVITEIRRAPARRIDNILTRLHEHSRKLRVHARVCSSATRTVRNIRWQFLGIGIAAVVLGIAVAYLTATLGAAWHVPLCVAFGGLLAGAGLYAFGRWQAQSRGRELLTGLSGVFESVYHKDLVLSGAADDLKALWLSVQDRAVQALETLGLDAIKPLSTAEEKAVKKLINEDIPALRSRVHNAIRKLAADGKFTGPVPNMNSDSKPNAGETDMLLGEEAFEPVEEPEARGKTEEGPGEKAEED